MPAKEGPDMDMQATIQAEPRTLNGTLRKLRRLYIGFFALTCDEIEALTNRLVDRGEIAEQNGRKLLREALNQQKETTVKVRKGFSRHSKGVQIQAPVASKADLAVLDAQLSAISEQISELNQEEHVKRSDCDG